VRVGGYATTDSVHTVAIDGNYAYLGLYSNTLDIVDITDPANCQRIGGCSNLMGFVSSDIAFRDNFL
jgi:hypothetical protein